LFGAMEDAKKP